MLNDVDNEFLCRTRRRSFGERGFIRFSINGRVANARIALGSRGWRKPNDKNQQPKQNDPARLHLKFTDHPSLIHATRGKKFDLPNLASKKILRWVQR